MPTWSSTALIIVCLSRFASTPLNGTGQRPRHELPRRRVGVELSPGDSIDDRRELVLPQDVALEVRQKPLRDELAQPVLAAGATPRRLPRGFVCPETIDGVDQLRDTSAPSRDGCYDRGSPFLRSVRTEGQRGLDARNQSIRALPIGFVHDEDISDLHDAGLECLHLVARTWYQNDD